MHIYNTSLNYPQMRNVSDKKLYRFDVHFFPKTVLFEIMIINTECNVAFNVQEWIRKRATLCIVCLV
jgi:hypothetical protein